MGYHLPMQPSAGSSALLGVDIGGSNIKGAVVDLSRGEFVTERVKRPTPSPATPDLIADVVEEVIAGLSSHPASRDGSPVGVTVPGVVRDGVVQTAANIDKSWVGTDADRLLEDRLGRPVHVMNDADAAGYAEVAFGAAQGREGMVLVVTLGTGIGTAMVHDGRLVPNTELGHLEIEGRDAETRASNAAREREDLGWEEWAARLTTYFGALERLLTPALFVVGGGVSKHAATFLPMIDIETEIVPAALLNSAGIIGAAVLAGEHGG